MSNLPSDRTLELAEIALESAAQACQSGASLRQKKGLDPLAREYLEAARDVAQVRSALAEACDLLQHARSDTLDPGLKRAWAARRKVLTDLFVVT